ncbi:hypothetical protein RQP46_009575 [Phenoliferia psychrophenolica]
MTSSIPATMRAAQILEKGGPYVIRDIPVPEVGPWQILMKTACAGHCHTDMMVADGEFGDDFPITGSHEPAGTVAKMGAEAIKLGKFKVGDRIAALATLNPCGVCWDCKENSVAYCIGFQALGINSNGAFADYTLVDARATVSLPESMAWDQTLGIIGLGALGHLAVQYAKAAGYIVVGVDARSEPIEMTKALKLAPDVCINAATTSVEEALVQISALDPKKPLRGLDACLVVNDVAASFQYAVDLLARHGTFVLVGQPVDGVTFTFKDLIFKDIRVIGSLYGDCAQAQTTVALAAKHNIVVHTSKYKLDDMAQLLIDAHAPGRKGKSVVMF